MGARESDAILNQRERVSETGITQYIHTIDTGVCVCVGPHHGAAVDDVANVTCRRALDSVVVVNHMQVNCVPKLIITHMTCQPASALTHTHTNEGPCTSVESESREIAKRLRRRSFDTGDRNRISRFFNSHTVSHSCTFTHTHMH